MKSPVTNKEMIIKKEERELIFRKEKFRILSHYYYCKESGEKFEDEILSELNYNQLINQYREKFNLPFPDQIKNIRKKYNVSASKMSDILGFGTNTYRQYENGEVPNQSNAKLISLTEDPHEFRKLVKINTSIKENEKKKILIKTEDLLKKEKAGKENKKAFKYFIGDSSPNIFTGYKKTDIDKLTEMVVYFAEKMEPWKTQLNKLLFYCDFYFFKNHAYSISGAKYRAIKLGPVPDNFTGIYEIIAKNEHVLIDYIPFPDGGIGEKFQRNKNRKFNKKLFTNQELEVMELVAEKYQNKSTAEIIEISHKEKAWLENKGGNSLINYNYSFEM